jgi:hypothetical protein
MHNFDCYKAETFSYSINPYLQDANLTLIRVNLQWSKTAQVF